MNPIIKTRGGRHINGSISHHGVFIRQWAYVCPLCPDAEPVIVHGSGRYAPFNRNTRKIAKDQLHQHLLKKHGAPR